MMIDPYVLIHLSLNAPEAAKSDFLRIAFTVAVCTIAVLAGIFITLHFFNLIYRHHRRLLTADKWLQIENQGNTDSVFQIQPETGPARVSTTLFYRDRPLDFAVVVVPEPEIQTVQTLQSKPSASQNPAAQSVQPLKDAPVKTSKETAAAAAAAKDAKKKAMGGVNFGRKIGGIIGGLGTLLPGEAGKAFKDQSDRLQGITQKASQAIEEPEQKKEEMENLRREIQGLGGRKQPAASIPQSTGMPAVEPEERTALPKTSPAPLPGEIDMPSPARRVKNHTKRIIYQKGIFQTELIKAGENLRLKLVLSPVNIYRSMSVPLCIHTRQMICNETGNLQAINTSETWETFTIQGLPVSKTICDILVGLLIAAINIFWVTLVFKWFIGSYI